MFPFLLTTYGNSSSWAWTWADLTCMQFNCLSFSPYQVNTSWEMCDGKFHMSLQTLFLEGILELPAALATVYMMLQDLLLVIEPPHLDCSSHVISQPWRGYTSWTCQIHWNPQHITLSMKQCLSRSNFWAYLFSSQNCQRNGWKENFTLQYAFLRDLAGFA